VRAESSLIVTFPLLVWWLLGLFVIVAATGQVAGEFESGTIRTVWTTPLSRGGLLWAKYAACAIHAALLVAFTAVVAVFLRGVLFGEWDLPLRSGFEDAVQLLRPGQRPVDILHGSSAAIRLAAGYGYLLAFLLALAALSMLIASALRHTVSALSVTIALLGLTWVASSVEPLAPLRPLLLVDQARGWLWVWSGIVPWERVTRGLVCIAAYVVASLLGAWTVFARRDVNA
jgi:ABC-2 type transport system permease protein